ncbi:MAG: N-acetyltransferase [Oribacterium sp.]|nr:N-acetyltransferase [Oribacterium sp.]
MGITIRLEEEKDYRNVENLIRDAFWNVYRPGCMEHYVMHCFREDPAFIKQLLDATLEKAKEAGYGAVIMEGNIDFYGKSGFVSSKSKGIRYADDPEADYLLCLELKQGYLDGIDGTWSDPSGYYVCQNDPEGFEKFEADFPYKEKKKLPGQLFG